MGILKILFTILLFMFPLGEITRFSLGSGISFSLNDVAVLIFTIFGLIYFFVKKENFKKSELLLPILFFSVAAFISIVLNSYWLKPSEMIVSSLYIVRWLAYAGIYFIVTRFEINFKKKILNYMIIAGLIFCLIGYIQYFFYQNLRNLYYLGWDDHLYRMFSSFFDPNFTGAFLVLYLLLISSFLFKSIVKKQRKKIMFFSLLSVITTIAIFLTYSRSALIMFVITFFTFFVVKTNKKWAIGFVIIVLFLILMIAPSVYKTENTNYFRVASTLARIESVNNALIIIRDNPLFGIGFNAYRYAQIKYSFREGEGAMVSHADSGTDNSFLFVFATSGIIGFLFYIYLISKIIRRSFSSFKYKKNEFTQFISLIVFCSVIGIVFNSFFVNSLFFPFIMEWIWIIVGLKENT